jgi:pimeloyl-ACP methyl ester carboxylesterase
MLKTSPAAPVLAVLLALAGTAEADTVTVDGHTIYHEVHGDLDAAATPVLLLHGGMMTIDLTFAELIPPLSETRAVIAVEQQGHGRTGDRETPITLESMRADTLGVWRRSASRGRSRRRTWRPRARRARTTGAGGS